MKGHAITLSYCCLLATHSAVAEDAYENYVRTSQDFRAVKQDKEWALKAWPSWTCMPWTHQWGIGYDDDSGRWSLAHGYNGAFIDRDGIGTKESKTGRLDWINQHGLGFYVDHAAGKGSLHLWDGDKVKAHFGELHGTGGRPVALNAATRTKLEELLRLSIGAVKASPHRAAYALDDEASWGHFVHPTMWQIMDDAQAYPRWLEEVYGKGGAPKRERWMSYEDLRAKLATWSIAEFDASSLLDQWSFNDSHWCNFIGGLVEFANTLDPATPCGLVGGHPPNAFGGYDYAKLMRKVQFIESYNLGSSQAIIRSFNPRNALPAVTTHFHKSVEDTVWQTWYYLAHGNRGFIGWVEKWFDGKTPKPWHAQVAPCVSRGGQKSGLLMTGTEWLHDGVAVYYSHASIQLGWVLDAEAHGKTWTNRNADERLSSAAHVRRACDASGFHKAVRAMPVGHIASLGKGKAVLMNLSPRWYNAHRSTGAEAAKKREVFMRHVTAAGVAPWVRIANAGEREHGYEITYWSKADRTILFLCLNPEFRGTSLGGGNSVGLKTDTVPIKLRFTEAMRNVRDERTGRDLGSSNELTLEWKQNESVVLSFDVK